MIEVDPKIEQAFAEVLARSRHRAADITDRLRAVQRGLEEESKRIKEEGKRLSDELDRRVARKRESTRNPWQNREAKPTVLEFGTDEEDRRPAPAQPALAPPAATAYPVLPPPKPGPRPAVPEQVLSFEVEDGENKHGLPTAPRPAADDDDDLSGRSWMH